MRPRPAHSSVLLVFLLVVMVVLPAHALVFRREGQTYPIKERYMLDVIQEKIAAIDMDAFQEKVQSAIKNQAENFRAHDAVSGLPAALESRQYRVDLSYTVPQDVVDLHGNVIYPSGYRLNPLQVMAEQGMTYPFMLMVINGERKVERDWFVASQFNNPRVKLLVTDGYPYKLATELHRPVYQLSEIVKERFQLQETPSLVFWPLKSDFLAVRTIPIPEPEEETPSDSSVAP